MAKTFNQMQAMLAITNASLRAVFRSPSAVVFSLVFPLIFILVFGFMGGGGRFNLKIAVDTNSDTLNQLYGIIKNVSGINIIRKDTIKLGEDLERGRITAMINIRKSSGDSLSAGGHEPLYIVDIKSSNAVSPQNLQVLRGMLDGIIKGINQNQYPNNFTYAQVNSEVKEVPGRVYRTIDFILPGQLGFSLLSSGVFGVAFIFFNLRQSLVLKRFFATPIKRSYIVFGEAISRIIFQLMTAVVILTIGHFFFKFTLVHGIITFLELLILSILGLIVFMGFGFVVSSLAKNESTIPPFANLITLPQFLLAGTFFSIDNFPKWLQPICKVLPLTHLNNAMRNVAFEGAHLSDCLKEIGIISLWGIAVYAIAIKVFRWE
jgi:ABC-2 type transport system permease protein